MTAAPENVGTRFPIPLVGAAVILVVLIILTPVLITGGGGAGSLLTQATLVVDHPTAMGGHTTTFTIEGVGPVRYAEIRIGLNESYSSHTPLKWINWTRWVNGSNLIASYVTTNATDVAVNVSAYYVSSTGVTGWYYGIISATYDPPQQTLTLRALTSGIAVPGGPISTTGNRLPVIIALAYQSSAGPPP